MDQFQELDEALDVLAARFVAFRRDTARPATPHVLGAPLAGSPLAFLGPITAENIGAARQMMDLYVQHDLAGLRSSWSELPEPIRQRVIFKISLIEFDALMEDLREFAARLKWASTGGDAN